MNYHLKNGLIISQTELDQLEAAGLSEEEIAFKFKITRMALYKIRKKMDWPIHFRSDKGKKGVRVSLENQRLNRNEYHREYRNGRDIDYKEIHINGNRHKEHRYIAEQTIGRKLSQGLIVHHIDGNRKNNDIDNLFICLSKDHLRIHSGKVFIEDLIKNKQGFLLSSFRNSKHSIGGAI